MSKAFALILVLLLGVAGQLSAAPEDPNSSADESDVVAKVVAYYNAGKISDAELTAHIALDAPEDLSKFERFTLHKILAFCSVANDNDDNAIFQFREALRVNPAMKPDPITWSPKVRELFAQAKQQSERDAAVEEYYRVTLEADLGRRASLKSLYLPGAGQLMKGHDRGIYITLLFVGAAATFIYSQSNIPSARERYENATDMDDIEKQWKRYSDLYHLSYISGSVAGSVYIYAYFDALWSKPNIELLLPKR